MSPNDMARMMMAALCDRHDDANEEDDDDDDDKPITGNHALHSCHYRHFV